MFPPHKALLFAATGVRYGLAIAASLLALGIASLTHGVPSPGIWVSVWVFAFAAVIFSAAWAGPGPGLAATVISGAGATLLQLNNGRPLQSAIFGFLLFTAEGIFLCIGSARMLHVAKQAAASEARYRNLLDTASEGIWLQNGSAVITYANARMAEMLGVLSDSLIGRSVEEFYFPAELSLERMRAETLRNGPLTAGFRQQFDRRLRRTDGSEIWVLACCNAVTGESADALSMMTDITERKRAEQALRRSEQRYRDLFDGVCEGVWQSTVDGRIVAANPTLLKMLGYTREAQLRDMNVAKDLFVDPTLRRKLLEQMEREGTLRNVEYALRTAQGTIVHVLENARVIRDEHGAVTGYEGTLSDITAKKGVEEQLREARKVEALGRLAGGIAHDFDSVLSQIAVHAESVLDHLPSGHPAHAHAGLARDAAKNGMALTRQLISFSRRPRDPEPNHLPVMPREEPNSHAEGGETILLVEDDVLVRELSRDMLERQGYRVILAADAADAERISAGSHFDLLIADAKMPSMTGQELARRLRTIHPELRVLFVSGYEEIPQGEAQPTLPTEGYIYKPFSADSLSRKIRHILSRA